MLRMFRWYSDKFFNVIKLVLTEMNSRNHLDLPKFDSKNFSKPDKMRANYKRSPNLINKTENSIEISNVHHQNILLEFLQKNHSDNDVIRMRLPWDTDYNLKN
ncbi:Nucleolar GTP-binding protein 2 [Sarcoptes scabiei]|uniref:Uncharacterized protein n=1 Tax=Sarcoptes scabiei TaxID=52283 RepID=A0A132A580_SARSC|nr:hypothetical protein QR98_0045960 [Sarcoptes scabiei]UXI16915.1 Nucleolar GTP-binding protein 2 [Sarcoptes scabiei]